MPDRELRALPVGHGQAPLLRLVRLVPAAGRLRPGQDTGACSGPVTASRTWNSHAVSGVVAGRGCAFTRNSDTSQCPSCRRARPRSTTCGWSLFSCSGPSPPSARVTVADPCTGTRCHTRDCSDFRPPARSADPGPLRPDGKLLRVPGHISSAAHRGRGQADDVRRRWLRVILAQVRAFGVGGLVLGIRLDHGPVRR